MTYAMQFSTTNLPPADGFDFWRESSREFAGVALEPVDDQPAAYRAAITIRAKGALRRHRTQCDAVRVRRGPREIAGRSSDCYIIYREFSDGVHFRFGEKELTAARGALLIGDYDRPFETWPVAEFDHEILLLPKSLLEPHLPAGAGHGILGSLSASAGLSALVTNYYEALIREWDDIPAISLDQAADVLCRLIGVACGASAEDQSGAVCAARLTEAKRYVASHLAEPSLSSARTAAALKISERALYAAFEPTGISFAAYVRRRRLDECRTALLANLSRPVIDIAFSWGFGSLPSFYRAFRAEFGISPSDLRQAGRAGLEDEANAENEMRLCGARDERTVAIH
jgi:AraC-like DNA-binding protein